MRLATAAVSLAGLGVMALPWATVAGATAPPIPQEQEAAAGRQDTVYVGSVSLFPTLVQLPVDYDESATYRLVVGLHGHGGRQNDFFEPPASLFRDAGLIYAVPQAPYAYLPSNRIGYSWNLRDVDDFADNRGDEVTIRYILDVIESLRERYSVGEVYLMGFSQGGTFTYYTAITHHDLFAGLATFGSRLNEQRFAPEELAAANHLRAFVAGGTLDTGAQPVRARYLLDEAGFDVTLYQFDAGHTITRVAMEEFIDWVKR